MSTTNACGFNHVVPPEPNVKCANRDVATAMNSSSKYLSMEWALSPRGNGFAPTFVAVAMPSIIAVVARGRRRYVLVRPAFETSLPAEIDTKLKGANQSALFKNRGMDI